ncbi:UDP-N-acetylmuramoyl-L-alanyl-D-glutamate--2,6-diaminopimelate ligase [Candidatus Peregrinibacteria bacterium]|nr:UDP-N-acetylmuramoyl-L-alanyl-D-glutamate--2,6-diaminopimelate ligase [Candidatus Peregrinibacteria bacterium]
MLSKIKKLIPDTHPIRLIYHRILGMIAAIIYRYPAGKLTVIGVTGTNGKTTCVNLITNILRETGEKVGMTSTINFQVGDKRWVNDTKQTTLSPFQLQKLLRQMVDGGCKYAVLEVSSHAVTQSRVYGVNFDLAMFTNVTPEHIEYHGSFDSYLDAKMRLFKWVANGKRKSDVKKTLVLNRDDEYFDHFDKYSADQKITYGMDSKAIVYASDIKSTPSGNEFNLHVPNNTLPLKIKLPGKYNVYNAIAAASCALGLLIPLDTIKSALENSAIVSGRFEHVDLGQKFDVIVDYAHTPDALDNLFSLYKELTKNRLFVVFGATGGGRDKSKRPEMGQIANKYADYIILTNDDPYEEDQIQIINQIAEGVKKREGEDFWKIPDRREAIRLALTKAKEGDTVVVAGKGAEEVIMLGKERLKWNDKNVITELIKREISVNIE